MCNNLAVMSKDIISRAHNKMNEEDNEWSRSIGKKVDDFFATATDADIEQLLIDSNFEHYNTVQNVGILDV